MHWFRIVDILFRLRLYTFPSKIKDHLCIVTIRMVWIYLQFGRWRTWYCIETVLRWWPFTVFTCIVYRTVNCNRILLYLIVLQSKPQLHHSMTARSTKVKAIIQKQNVLYRFKCSFKLYWIQKVIAAVESLVQKSLVKKGRCMSWRIHWGFYFIMFIWWC